MYLVDDQRIVIKKADSRQNVVLWGWNNYIVDLERKLNGDKISKIVHFKEYNWQSGFNPHILWRLPPILPNLLFFKFCSTSNPLPTSLSVVLFLWLNWWSHYTWCVILLNDIMDLHMSSLATLVPEGKKDLDVFYATWYQVYWGLTYVDFCQYCTLI